MADYNLQLHVARNYKCLCPCFS